MGWREWMKSFLPAQAGAEAHAVLVNPDDTEKVHLAFDRLGAIRRHIEDRRREQRTVSAQRMAEFRAEARGHAAFLLQQKRIGEKDHELLLKGIV